MNIADSAKIRKDVRLDELGDGKIVIKHNAAIGERSIIAANESVVIGEFAMLAPNVYICDTDHGYEDILTPPMCQPLRKPRPIVLGNNCWVGINCVILASVGKGSVIGANSVVTKDIPDYCVAVGQPAKCVKRYNFNNKLWEKVK